MAKKMRLANGFTQSDIASLVNISRQYFNSIETGVRTPPVWTAKKIAKALGFDWRLFYPDEAAEATAGKAAI